jgi:NAD(P)-dependent dehydrogenase (short-subunit alcohol dehydrogenase family)
MNALRQDKTPVVISGPSLIGTATVFVFANAGPKVVVASRRESEREIAVHGAETVLVRVYSLRPVPRTKLT